MVYRVFICHAYDHRDIYFKLVQKLNAENFAWRNESVQYDMRFGHDDDQLDDTHLRNMVGAKIAECDVMLALTKPVASRRAWLQWEIKLAKELGKPVIGIARYRNDRVSKFVRDQATEIVDTWRIDHITNAIEWNVDDLRRRRGSAEIVKRLAPSVMPLLVRSPPDEEVPPNPSPSSAPPPPPEAAQADAEVDASEVREPDGFFRDLGQVVPSPPAFMQPKPRWWRRFGRHSS
jgi:hypothetical protein